MLPLRFVPRGEEEEWGGSAKGRGRKDEGRAWRLRVGGVVFSARAGATARSPRPRRRRRAAVRARGVGRLLPVLGEDRLVLAVEVAAGRGSLGHGALGWLSPASSGTTAPVGEKMKTVMSWEAIRCENRKAGLTRRAERWLKAALLLCLLPQGLDQCLFNLEHPLFLPALPSHPSFLFHHSRALTHPYRSIATPEHI